MRAILEERLRIHRLKRSARTFQPLRSTCTSKNFEEFRPYLELCATGVDVDIPHADFPRCGERSLYQKLCDAFLWAMNYEDKQTQERYAALRGATFIDRRSDRIMVRHRKDIVGARDVGRSAAHAPSAALNWKQEFLEWLENGPTGVPYVRQGLTLGADDIQFVKTMCKDVGADCEVTVNQLKAIKYDQTNV